MDLQYLTGASHTLQTLAFASIVVAILAFLPHINYNAQLRKLPAYKYEDGSKKRTVYLKSAKKLYRDGYHQFKDSVWRMATSEGVDHVVIPQRFLPELRKLPDSVVSFPESIKNSMHVKYTQIPIDQPIGTRTVKADLTPSLARMNPVICAEVEEAMNEEMPPCEDWTPVSIYMTLVNIVAKVSGRVFVGPELCRNKDYLDAGINYTMDLIAAQQEIHTMRPWLRPFLAPRLASVKRLRTREKTAHDLFEPIVRARKEGMKNPDYQRPDDTLQWMMNRSAGTAFDTVEELARTQLGLIFAAIHTTTLTATNILYTLAVQPEYLEPLREEIRSVMADNDGIITSRALQQMEKLDSYMKETTRFYPPGFTSFQRKVIKGFTLSNGQYIPAGVTIEVPSHAVYQDSANYPDGEKFDGFRHYKLRQQGGATNHARNQFVTTNEQNLGFGFGAHACPGRFFAANEIKMILARMVLDFDFKNLDGGMERYPNFEVGRQTSPDASRQLLFRRVRG